MTQYHRAVDVGDVAPTVTPPAEPGGMSVIAALWDEARDEPEVRS